MTCKQVLALMNALPLAEYPPAQLEAAERHARHCSRCKAVVTSSKALDVRLSRLAEPVLPAGLHAAILRRIALQGRAVAPLSGSDRRVGGDQAGALFIGSSTGGTCRQSRHTCVLAGGWTGSV